MGEQFKLNTDGLCPSCDIVSQEAENIQCFTCKSYFHCACPSCSEDEKVGTKSLVTAFNRTSTKKNFKFYCDVCITNLEISIANSESRRLGIVETNVAAIKSELADIKNLLKQSVPKQEASKPQSDNIWFNKERLATTKIAPAKPMLVVDKTDEEN